MKTRGFIYGILLILGLSLIGLLFNYGMWMLTDAYFRQEFLKERPWHSWENSAKPFCKVDTKKGRPLRLAPWSRTFPGAEIGAPLFSAMPTLVVYAAGCIANKVDCSVFAKNSALISIGRTEKGTKLSLSP